MRVLTAGIIAVLLVAATAGIVLAGSSGLLEKPVAQMLTDVPQMALYAAAFNTSQSRYRIHVLFDGNVVERLSTATERPTLVIGRFLKSSTARPNFQSLDHLFSELVINQSTFYPDLLELGNYEGRQMLLPVSFNLPLVVFNKSLNDSMADSFVLDLKELEAASATMNVKGKTGYTKMGFGPRWSTSFLFSAAELYGAGFREGEPLRWDEAKLGQSVRNLTDWSVRANVSIRNEDDFQFKYLYLPGYKSVQEGRIGFAAMDSREFFVISEERRNSLSFRWLSLNGKVPVAEDIVYAGITRRSSGKSAAEAFLKWYYAEETQKMLLDDARQHLSMESSFGLAGGFSALRSVNEKLYPQYYPSLLGKVLPAGYLQPPDILPSDWPAIKKAVVEPFLLDATGSNPPENLSQALNDRLAVWLKRRTGD